MWGAHYEEKSVLYFSVFAGNRQRSLSQIWVQSQSQSQSHATIDGRSVSQYVLVLSSLWN
jgi:hypothetical protein